MSTQPSHDQGLAPWQDPALPAEERVEWLVADMTLREKIAQLYGVWVGVCADGGDMAPFQHEMSDGVDLESLIAHGLGQLTRPFGSAPVDPAVGALSLARTQRRIIAASRHGIPALAHEECLAGFTAWGATAYPVPLSWGATWNPRVIETMAARIGASMRAVGVHQGLAPVLDVVLDQRWGRVEETVGEDPYLVGTITSAYVSGLQGAGIIATLKHFAGYSASKGGRNLAPVSIGPREYSDVILAPFEMAVRETGVDSVMHAYVDVDGVPAAANRALLTGLLRDTWGFRGTVVADYFGVAFLHLLHGVAGTLGEAAAKALTAGLDVELPTVHAYAEPLLAEVESGRLPEAIVDASLRRVLAQKLRLGMLDRDWEPIPVLLADADPDDPEAQRGRLCLDTEDDRALAREIAEQAVVLVANDGTLPLASTTEQRILVTGPTAEDPVGLLGCYSFPSHVGVRHPEAPLGIEIPSVLEAIEAEFPAARVSYVPGVSVDGRETDGIAAAVAAARDSDIVIALLGDRAGLFGRGTSGEGCDAPHMGLPGRQQDLLDALLQSGTPVVTVLVEGRPYALGAAATDAAAIVVAFFPGEAGGAAISGVLSGRVNPAGRLPVTIPRDAGGQPATYLGATLAQRSDASNLDPTGAFAFGHGLTYTSFEWGELTVDGALAPGAAAGGAAQAALPAATLAVDGAVTLSVTVRNDGPRAGVEVIQLYLHDPVASVVRPVNRLIAHARVELEPDERRSVSFEVPADVTSFTGADGRRIVEPGRLELRLGASSRDLRRTAVVQLTGETRIVDHTRRLHCDVRMDPVRAERATLELTSPLGRTR